MQKCLGFLGRVMTDFFDWIQFIIPGLCEAETNNATANSDKNKTFQPCQLCQQLSTIDIAVVCLFH